jgi:hypothetical protein
MDSESMANKGLLYLNVIKYHLEILNAYCIILFQLTTVHHKQTHLTQLAFS